MLDRETLNELCQLKLLTKRLTRISINIERFVNDTAYQDEILTMTEEQDEEQLVFLSISMRDRLGRLNLTRPDVKPMANIVPSIPEAPEKITVEEEVSERYIFSLR